MSSVLHPVGPEPRERYWVRRLAVLVAAVVAIVVVIALVGNAMSAGSAVQAEPAPPSLAAPTPPPATASASPSSLQDSGVSPSASSAAPTSGPSPTAGSAASSSAQEQEAEEKAADKEAADKKAADKEAAAKKAADKKAAAKKAAKKKTTEQPVYPACDGSRLRPTLTGDPRVEVGKKTTFALSLINGGKKTCTARVNPERAALTIVSGSDRIWSSKDCPEAMPVTKRTLLPEHSLEWKVTWDGTRSGDGCSVEEEVPRKGYYWAIASVDGTDSVRFRVILS